MYIYQYHYQNALIPPHQPSFQPLCSPTLELQTQIIIIIIIKYQISLAAADESAFRHLCKNSNSTLQMENTQS